MIRWLLLASHVPAGGSGGGIVRYTVELARALDQRDDVQLHVLSQQDAVGWWTSLLPPDRVHPLPSLPTPALSLVERYGSALPLFRQQWDVVHGTKHLLPRRVRGRAVLTLHDFLPLDRPEDFGTLKRHLLPGPYLASAAGADVLVSVSTATATRLGSYLPGSSDRVRVVPLANEAPSLRSAPAPIPDLENETFAVVVGDANYRKNLPLVVDAWGAVRDEVPAARLAVIGPEPWGQTRTHTNREIDPGVLFCGRVPDAELHWAYRNATVALCPSILEGFGLPTVEALRLGTPVITSEDPALCEVSGQRATHISALEPAAWRSAIIDHLRSPRRQEPMPPRTWTDVATDTVEAVIA